MTAWFDSIYILCCIKFDFLSIYLSKVIARDNFRPQLAVQPFFQIRRHSYFQCHIMSYPFLAHIYLNLYFIVVLCAAPELRIKHFEFADKGCHFGLYRKNQSQQLNVNAGLVSMTTVSEKNLQKNLPSVLFSCLMTYGCVPYVQVEPELL